MTLSEYLETNSLTLEAFGELIGRDKSTVSLLRRGKTKPDRETVDRIHRATDGQVTANDFFHAQEPAA